MEIVAQLAKMWIRHGQIVGSPTPHFPSLICQNANLVGKPLAQNDHGATLRIIGAFKLFKAILLIGVSLSAFKLIDPAIAKHVDEWFSTLAWHFGPQATISIHNKLTHLRHTQLATVGIVALVYALLFAVEGVGLWIGKRWAEYLTIVATGSLVPFEIYEIVQDVTWPRIATLVINLFVVGYLIWKVRKPRLVLSST